MTHDPLTVAEILQAGVLRTSMHAERAAAQSTWDTDGGAGGPVKADCDLITTGHWSSSNM
jgi:hypothetical protein